MDILKLLRRGGNLMGMQTMVYIYLFVCGSMILFEIACSIVFKRREKLTEDYKKVMKAELYYMLIRVMDEGVMQEAEKEQLFQFLKKPEHMAAWESFLEEQKQKKPQRVQVFLYRCLDVMDKLAVYVSEKEDLQKAQFANFLSDYRILSYASDSACNLCILRNLSSHNVYVRENSLQAIYHSGSVEAVCNALSILEQSDCFHHGKLITEGLMGFIGDKKYLASTLLERRKEYSLEMQINIFNFVRFADDSKRNFFLQILEDESEHDELRFGAIRYFRRYKDSRVVPYLMKYLTNPEECRWEYTAISASTMEQYPSEEVMRALLQCLYHANWHVRYNAAESLMYMPLRRALIQEVYDSGDQYAKEMLEFRLNESEIIFDANDCLQRMHA